MRLTSKGRYAVRAMLDLCFHSTGQPVRLQEISDRQKISLHYLEQLFRKLRKGQVVKSVRGPGGGYILSRSMDEICVKDVLSCVGENINPAKDIIGKEECRDTHEYLIIRDFFQKMGVMMQEYLQTTSLGDLKRRGQMYSPWDQTDLSQGMDIYPEQNRGEETEEDLPIDNMNYQTPSAYGPDYAEHSFAKELAE